MNAPSSFFASFTDVEAHLDGLGLFRMTPGLGRMTAILQRLKLTRPPYKVIQVVGTNGKGSTSSMLASLAKAHGLRVGLHTSPHFLSVRERIRIDGAMLTEERWTQAGNILMEHGGEDLSYFEFVTALAVLAFSGPNSENPVDVAIMETGLGGTFDATTALEADAVVFTPIALDHQSVLGNSLAEIAADKAGAIRTGKPVISARQKEIAWQEITRIANERGAPLHEVPVDYPLPLFDDTHRPRLQGAHQEENARLALASWHTVSNLWGWQNEKADSPVAKSGGYESNPDAIGIAKAWIPGRLQELPPKPSVPGAFSLGEKGWPQILLDGAHNVHGLSALGLALGKAGIAPIAVIFSCLADKDISGILPLLRALATGKIFVPPIADNPRAMDPHELASMIGLNAEPVDSMKDALAKATAHIEARMPEVFSGDPKHPLLICGSLYMLGEFYCLRPDALGV